MVGIIIILNTADAVDARIRGSEAPLIKKMSPSNIIQMAVAS